MLFNGHLSIRKKLVISYMLVSLVPFLAVSLFSLVYFQREKEEDIVSKLHTDLAGKAVSIKKTAEGKFEDLKGIGLENGITRDALSSYFQNPPTEDSSVMRTILVERYLPHFRQYLKGDALRLIVIAKAVEAESQAVVGEVVYALDRSSGGEITENQDTSLQLRSLLNGRLHLDGSNQSVIQQIFKKASNDIKPALHDFSQFNGVYSYFISIPLLESEGMISQLPAIDRSGGMFNSDNRSIGMVIVQLETGFMDAVLGSYYGLGEIYLTGRDAKKSFRVHSKVKVLKDESGNPVKQGSKAPDYVNQFKLEKEGPSSNTRILLSYPVEVHGHEWYIIADIDKDKVFAHISDLRRMYIIIGVVGSICIMIVAYFSGRAFSSPLLKLTDFLVTLGKTGDLTLRMDHTRKDEIGHTIEAVNDLVGSFNTAITDISNVMEATAQGDLSLRIKGNYHGSVLKLKECFNKSLNMLVDTMSYVLKTAGKVNFGVEELDKAARLIANGTSCQAASLEEVASSVNEIRRQAQDNNQNARNMKELASEAFLIVEKGNRQMEAMLQSMANIQESSEGVGKLIRVIDEIAFQTNLLALNAAVEAARAGKHGRGFSIVADEVRKLANRSIEAVETSTRLIESSSQEVSNGVSNSRRLAEILDQITNDITKVDTLVNEVADASIDQVEQLAEIDQGLSVVNEVVQQNSAASEKTASASSQLLKESHELQVTIKGFKMSQKGEYSSSCHIDGPVTTAQGYLETDNWGDHSKR